MIEIKQRQLTILDFDIENRPLSYLGQDFTTADITAIAWKWIGSKGKPTVYALGEVSSEEMLIAFVEEYNKADIVTGHYIREHDLPMINGALSDFDMPPLSPKLVSDTKLDMIKRKGMSGSQENIGGMLGLQFPKFKMTQHEWRAANRLTKEGIKLTKTRVVADVEQHIEMREALIKRGWLLPPKVWGEDLPSSEYQP